MAEHIWSVLCRNHVIDKASNEVSLFQAIEKITVTIPVPFSTDTPKVLIPFQMDLASYWFRSKIDRPEKSDCRITLTAPDGEVLTTTLTPIDLTDFVSLRATMRSEVIPLKSPGYFHFNVYLAAGGGKWNQVARVPFEVEIKIAVEEAPKGKSRRGGSPRKISPSKK